MIPTLRSERLILRPLREDDLDASAAMYADPEVMRYLGDGHVFTRQESWRYLAFLIGHWQLRGFGMWSVTLRHDDGMIGRAGFFQPEDWPGFEIGWTFARHAWGHGYATEAALCALRHGREVMRRDEVISVIHPENAASIRVAERIGERLLGTEIVNGRQRAIYGMRLKP
jgi:RimJ/RimL family protein N-acetyltransferase